MEEQLESGGTREGCLEEIWLEGPGERSDEEEHSKQNGGEGECLQAEWCKFLSQILESNHLELRNQVPKSSGVEEAYCHFSPERTVTSTLLLGCGYIRWPSHQLKWASQGTLCVLSSVLLQ